MDERQESQKDKIKKQVEINKSRSLDGTKLGSRNDTVNRFGVLGKDKSKSDDKSNIKSRIDASKALINNIFLILGIIWGVLVMIVKVII